MTEQMNEIKRYGPDYTNGMPFMAEDSLGGMVRLQDLRDAVAAERKRCLKEFAPLIVAAGITIQGLQAHTDPMLKYMEQSAAILRLQEALVAVRKIQEELP